LPRRAHFLDLIEIEVRDHKLVLIPAGLRHDFPARITEVALAVEFADAPRLLGSHAIDRRDEILICHRVRRLLQFPQVLRQAGNRGGRIENNLRAVQS